MKHHETVAGGLFETEGIWATAFSPGLQAGTATMTWWLGLGVHKP